MKYGTELYMSPCSLAFRKPDCSFSGDFELIPIEGQSNVLQRTYKPLEKQY